MNNRYIGEKGLEAGCGHYWPVLTLNNHCFLKKGAGGRKWSFACTNNCNKVNPNNKYFIDKNLIHLALFEKTLLYSKAL